MEQQLTAMAPLTSDQTELVINSLDENWPVVFDRLQKHTFQQFLQRWTNRVDDHQIVLFEDMVWENDHPVAIRAWLITRCKEELLLYFLHDQTNVLSLLVKVKEGRLKPFQAYRRPLVTQGIQHMANVQNFVPLNQETRDFILEYISKGINSLEVTEQEDCFIKKDFTIKDVIVFAEKVRFFSHLLCYLL